MVWSVREDNTLKGRQSLEYPIALHQNIAHSHPEGRPGIHEFLLVLLLVIVALVEQIEDFLNDVEGFGLCWGVHCAPFW